MLWGRARRFWEGKAGIFRERQLRDWETGRLETRRLCSSSIHRLRLCLPLPAFACLRTYHCLRGYPVKQPESAEDAGAWHTNAYLSGVWRRRGQSWLHCVHSPEKLWWFGIGVCVGDL